MLAIYCFDAEYALQLYSFGCGDYGEISPVSEFPALGVLNLDCRSAVGALGLILGGVPLVTAVEARCHALCVAYGEVVQGVAEAPLLLRFVIGDSRSLMAATLCWNRVCGLIGRRVIGFGCLVLPRASACCSGCEAG